MNSPTAMNNLTKNSTEQHDSYTEWFGVNGGGGVTWGEA